MVFIFFSGIHVFFVGENVFGWGMFCACEWGEGKREGRGGKKKKKNKKSRC